MQTLGVSVRGLAWRRRHLATPLGIGQVRCHCHTTGIRGSHDSLNCVDGVLVSSLIESFNRANGHSVISILGTIIT